MRIGPFTRMRGARVVSGVRLVLIAAVAVVGAWTATPKPAKADVFIGLPRIGIYIGDHNRDRGYHRDRYYAPRHSAPRGYHRPWRAERRAFRQGYRAGRRDGYYGYRPFYGYGARHHRRW